MKTIWMLLLVVSLAASAPAAESANDLFQQALAKERTEGNLQGAIKLYQRIVDKYAANRKVAAEALLQMAECQQKLGDAQSRRSLEKLVREFADQKETVAEASRRLALSGGGPAGQQTARAVWTGSKIPGSYACGLSPDGRFIIFPDWDTGNLTLHDFISGADRALTHAGSWKHGETASAEAAAVSRDGKQVAYAWFDDRLGGRYELRVIGLNGDSNPRRIFENASVSYVEPADWSPDGKWIAVYLEGKQVEKKTRQIGLIGVEDGSLRVLKSTTGTDYMGLGGFSSDGKYLVYTRGTGSIAHGYIMSADGKSEVPVMPGNSSVESPVWTPDGSRIVFVSDLSGSPGIWSVRVAEGRPQGEPELKADSNHARLVGFGRDGSLFYRLNLNSSDIYVQALDRSTGRLMSEPKRVNERVGGSWGRIAWLPDGKSLSFWNKEPINALVVHMLDAGEEREISGGKSVRSVEHYTGWFADGHSLMSSKKVGPNQVFQRVDSATGLAQTTWTIPDFPEVRGTVAPSPDLMTMYFSRKDETAPCEGKKCTFVLLARSLETGRDREIFRIKADWLRNLSISHDGRDLALTIREADEDAVIVASVGDGLPRELYRSNGEAFRFTAWTLDGGHVLAFRRTLGGEGDVLSIPTKGGKPEKFPMRIAANEQPVVSPDGTQIAFVAYGRKPEIWVMTGLFGNEKAAR
jgi:Tol biopolymer transport system component